MVPLQMLETHLNIPWTGLIDLAQAQSPRPGQRSYERYDPNIKPSKSNRWRLSNWRRVNRAAIWAITCA